MSEWLEKLSDEDKVFIKRLVMNSGSLKKLSNEYNVSYPTIRLRTDKLIQKIQLVEEENNNFKSKIMQLVIDGKITLDVAYQIINFYDVERN
ncbi:hypothetical protein CM54_12385 [Staphylococcus sp. TE8]|uniref:DUF2089 family protein n=1 Tax=Staphylococcus TaxID=1279 RepID=UPI00049EA3FD|nr:DUF2089 family protein [Staphylococcus sp. TE8]AID68648.1 hypothetical protein [Staphylococcus sp. TE8]KDE94331.1 hypothetical protein CM54_12385 [Staphylococcus sp. TE8]